MLLQPKISNIVQSPYSYSTSYYYNLKHPIVYRVHTPVALLLQPKTYSTESTLLLFYCYNLKHIVQSPHSCCTNSSHHLPQPKMSNTVHSASLLQHYHYLISTIVHTSCWSLSTIFCYCNVFIVCLRLKDKQLSPVKTKDATFYIYIPAAILNISTCHCKQTEPILSTQLASTQQYWQYHLF